MSGPLDSKNPSLPSPQGLFQIEAPVYMLGYNWKNKETKPFMGGGPSTTISVDLPTFSSQFVRFTLRGGVQWLGPTTSMTAGGRLSYLFGLSGVASAENGWRIGPFGGADCGPAKSSDEAPYCLISGGGVLERTNAGKGFSFFLGGISNPKEQLVSLMVGLGFRLSTISL